MWAVTITALFFIFIITTTTTAVSSSQDCHSIDWLKIKHHFLIPQEGDILFFINIDFIFYNSELTL